MLKWSFAAGRWLAQIAFGVSGGVFFFLVWLPNGTNHGISSLCLFIGLSKKKDVAFFVVHSEHSYYNYFHTFSLYGRSFFLIPILYEHAYLDI